MAAQNQEMIHFSVCLPRTDICTAEPQTIIYSSSVRPAVQEAKYKGARQDTTKPTPATNQHPPSRRSFAPLKEIQDFVQRFSNYAMCHAELQPVQANTYPRRPDSSSSQRNNIDLVPASSSYNVYLHAPQLSYQRARGEILQHLQLHVRFVHFYPSLIILAPSIPIRSSRSLAL